MKEALEFLKNAGTFYLATVDGNQPRVRPFGAVCGFEDKLYIVTNNEKDVYAQMQKNPRIEISGMTNDGKWIRLAAEAVRDDRLEARKAMLDANPSLRRMYSEDDGKVEVLYLQNAVATVCSFTDAPVTYQF
ncbi:MAG: pyridoxamine 5'-phosphate oxidase family protein [Lachnospiraceae bacterium]|nr:pyridoxamine 5'-phosphate oxidase family protein [Lachnospiraceae bacterium]